MKQVSYEVKPDGTIKGEALLLTALRQKPGKYRAEIYTEGRRTNQQNKYVHVVFTLAKIALYNAGYRHITNMEAAKQWFKERHLTVEAVNEVTG